MRVYPDFDVIATDLETVPRPLRAKVLEELDGRYERLGFRCRGNGKDENGDYLEVDIRPHTTLQQLHSFLEVSRTAAVTIEPRDITSLYGKNPISLGVHRILQSQGADKSGVRLLEPDQVADAIQNISRTVVNSGEIDSDVYDAISTDMIMNGNLDAAEAIEQDRWLDSDVRANALPSYDNYNDGLSEFGLDTDAISRWDAGDSGAEDDMDLFGDF